MSIRSDQEPAMKSIVSDIARARAELGGGRLNIENSPVDSSQSNGTIERYVLTVQQQVRVMKSARAQVGGGVADATQHSAMVG